jgi:nucleoside 2-deoxyribosyltransferase
LDAPESIQWRKRVTGVLAEHFSIRTPMAGKPHLEIDSDDGGLNDRRLTGKDIIHRDRRDVREADLVLVHLGTWDSQRPLIGTICELAWCWDQRTPVVAICAKDDYVMRNHPFISEIISHYVETEEEAIDLLNTYYA